MEASTDGMVVAISASERIPEMERRFLAAHPGAELLWTPYVESLEARSSKARHGGVNADGLPTPEITDELRNAWARTQVLVGLDLPAGVAELFPRLELLQLASAGYDKCDLGALASMGVRLTTASGLAAPSIAEFVMGRLLAEWKHFRALDAQQRAHDWTQQMGGEVAGRTLGIVGLGALGRAIARRARAFDMIVLATRASAQAGDSDPDVDELYPAAALDDMLQRCDAVVATLPANESTFDMFDASRFAVMAEGTVFVNVSRGSLVVETDLIEALRSGHLRAAVLDVTRVEPLPSDDPLWDAPNLYLSPHTSTSLDRYADNLVDLAADNLTRYVEGQPLRNEVDLTNRSSSGGLVADEV